MQGVVSGRSVLITGAGGSLGSALAKAIVQLEPRRLVLLDHSERNLYEIDSDLRAASPYVSLSSVLGDICDEGLLSEIFERHRPEFVYVLVPKALFRTAASGLLSIRGTCLNAAV